MPSPFNLARTALSDDLGLGIKPSPGRGVNKDGTFNVHRAGIPRLRTYEFYHQLITMGGFRFLGVVLAGLPVHQRSCSRPSTWPGHGELRSGPAGNGPLTACLDAFFFSAQTLTTVGYGAHPAPGATWPARWPPWNPCWAC